MVTIDFKGRVAIVTGGSQGIGEAIALTLAQHGADVVIASRTVSKVEAMVDRIRGLGRRSQGVPTDVGKLPDLRNLVDRTMAEFGRIDILVNNAGGTAAGARQTLLNVTEEGYQETFDMNVKSVMFLSQMVAPIMKQQGRGAIVHVSSIAGRHNELSRTGFAVYGAAKAAVDVLTRSMAAEWGPEVRVNAILPGMIDSGRATASRSPERIAARMSTVALHRMGTPDEMANVVAFLCSDAASYVTGACYDADGGNTSVFAAI
jgi:NAD(P)-dependent dehydrogenase (short-subunit alcohol dehydrogenase family)